MKSENRGLGGISKLAAATAEGEVLRREVLDAIECRDFVSALGCWGSWWAYDSDVAHLPEEQLGLQEFEEAAVKLSDFAEDLLEAADQIREWIVEKRKHSLG